jgi:hypothetical protein
VLREELLACFLLKQVAEATAKAGAEAAATEAAEATAEARKREQLLP